MAFEALRQFADLVPNNYPYKEALEQSVQEINMKLAYSAPEVRSHIFSTLAKSLLRTQLPCPPSEWSMEAWGVILAAAEELVIPPNA